MEFKEKITLKKESYPYNHPEIAEIEPLMINLVEKIKNNLAGGEYDYIISDDVSGRIPSLIFKKIINSLHPQQKIDILHIAGGKRFVEIMDIVSGESQPEEGDLIDKANAQEIYNQLQLVLQKKVRPKIKGKALLVTEFIETGRSVKALMETLAAAGIKFDIATLGQSTEYLSKIGRAKIKKLEKPGVEIFKSDINLNLHNSFITIAQVYAGVEKGEQPRPWPELYSKVVRQSGKPLSQEQINTLDELLSPLSEIENADYKKHSDLLEDFRKENKNITPEDVKYFRQAIIKTRQDIDTMAKRIMSQVWPK